jgi:hypothetical protein
MKKDKEEKIEIVTIEGVEYLTFPQTEIFTGVDKGVLQQQVNRKTLELKKIGKYGFVSYEKCLELREKNETHLKMKVLQELGTSDMSIEEIKELVEVTKQNRKIQ